MSSRSVTGRHFRVIAALDGLDSHAEPIPPIEKRSMRRPLKVVLTTLGVLAAVPVVALATTSIVNVVATHAGVAAIPPYGQVVEVDGRSMNVVDAGSGEETIVLLPGLGTAAPAVDFQPLMRELESRYRVIAVEPFGTGMSDQTDVPRTAENIVREVHEALHELGVERYTLMGHSIAGIYALSYVAAYGDEVEAFVGIDSSIPDQSGADEPIPTALIATLSHLGLTRVLDAVSPDAYAGLPYDEAAKDTMRALSARNTAAPTMLDEMDRAPENFATASRLAFPVDLPVLLFVAADNGEVPGWAELHDEQAASVDEGRVVSLPGGHYLHHTQAQALADGTTDFLREIAAR